MKDIIQWLSNNDDNLLHIVSIIVIVISIMYCAFYKIRFLCLKKATEKVAAVEKMSDLTGEQKFALVVQWIDDELPSIFKSSVVTSIIEALVQYAYNNSFSYMKNYIKRKTGYDISSLISEIQNNSNEDTNK